MSIDLIQLSLEALLDKFGAGKHKPGSGSAAALLGLISCKLISTVISLSRGKASYASVESHLTSINDRVAAEIEPALLRLFQSDSDQFDRVISSRQRRNGERDQKRRWTAARQALP